MRIPRGLILLTAVTAGCSSVAAVDCGALRRSTVLSGDIVDSTGAGLGRVVLALNETVDDPSNPPRDFDAWFYGPIGGTLGPLFGHVLGARLIDGSGETFRAITIAPGSQDLFVVSPTVPVTDPNTFQALRQQFLSGQVVAELTTDLPGRATIRVPLALDASGWYRPGCPY
jgi:hypothetical protein